MTVALHVLPEHPADLREYCLQLLTEVTAQQQLIAKLSHELDLFRRYVYGRRSEKLDPAQPIDKGRPGPGLLAQVITAKFADHLPLNRQVDIFARHGVDLSRQTLCDWVGAAARLLEPIYRDLTVSVLGGKVVQTDDTTVPVLDRARTTTRDGRLWVYVGDTRPADIVYDYTTTRSRAGPSAVLATFRGYLQADAYAGYDALQAASFGKRRLSASVLSPARSRAQRSSSGLTSTR